MKKNILTTTLILFILTMYSCQNQPDPEIWEYQPVIFSFQDASGKDLVKEAFESLIVNSEADVSSLHIDKTASLSEDIYSLEVIYSQPCMDPVAADIERCAKSVHCIQLDQPNYYTPRFIYYFEPAQDLGMLCFKPETSDQCSKAEKITLCVVSPIFGDDREHEIVLHFDDLKVARILLNGKECTFIQQTINDCYWHKRIIYKPEKAVVAYATIIL